MIFGQLYDVIIRSNAPIFWLAVFVDCWAAYAFLEPLTEFLAFLVQKLGQKTAKLKKCVCHMTPAGLQGGRPKILTSAKIT